MCEACIMGKQCRKPFPKRSLNRATELLEIIHSDGCGPMNVKSYGKSQYSVAFMNDYSRYTQVYFLKVKSEVLENFKFVNEIENRGKRIKTLRSDNCGGY